MTATDETAQPDGVEPSGEQKEASSGKKINDNQVTKLSINQYIVLMRKDVKRAEVWLTRKITSSLPRLRQRKGADAAKYHRRAERLLEELQVMKKLNPDEVSKYAICSKLSAAELEKEMDKLSTEQRVLARLAAHKLVQNKVNSFYEKYKVKKERVILLVKALGVRSAKKNKKKEKVGNEKGSVSKQVTEKGVDKKLKERGSGEKKARKDTLKKEEKVVSDEERLESDEEVEDESEEGGSEGEDEGNQSGFFVRAPASSDSEDGDSESDREFDDQIASDSDDEETSANFKSKVDLLKSSIDGEKVDTAKSKKKVDWKAMPLRNSVVDRSEGSLTVKRLNLSKLSGDTIEDVVKAGRSDPVKEEKRHIPADAFFLGAEIPETEPEPDNRARGSGKNRDFSDKRPGRPSKSESSFVQLGGNDRSFIPGKDRAFGLRKAGGEPKGKKFDKKGNRPAAKPVAPPVDEKLHPSWAAKRKQKEVAIDSFQGKKIKFDDD